MRAARRIERKRRARRRVLLMAALATVSLLGVLWGIWNVATPEPQVVQASGATSAPTWDPKVACADVTGEGGATLVTRAQAVPVGYTGINAQVGKGSDSSPPPWKLTLTTPGGLKRELTASPGDMIIWQGRAMEMISGCASKMVLRPSSVQGVTDPTSHPSTSDGLTPSSTVTAPIPVG